ncbi:MAG: hypothetical protein JSR36_15590 [Proteobacteria bacterium]|nr:hypothetical protein [Pseudomonadota bacterium]
MRAAFALVMLFLVTTSGFAAADVPDQWLLMVRTRNTDPSQEAAFNHWYDEIDVPDVLKVPGFQRAVRGQQLGDGAARPPHYVALYDIHSPAIDKTIIDMLMATWEMIRSGRDTSLLAVEERSYYQLTGDLPGRAKDGRAGSRYLLLERFGLADGHGVDELSAWCARRSIQAVSRPEVVSVRRFELYRVLMFEPTSAPRYLTVYTIVAADDQAAEQDARALLPQAAEGQGHGYAAEGGLSYALLRDSSDAVPHLATR